MEPAVLDALQTGPDANATVVTPPEVPATNGTAPESTVPTGQEPVAAVETPPATPPTPTSSPDDDIDDERLAKALAKRKHADLARISPAYNAELQRQGALERNRIRGDYERIAKETRNAQQLDILLRTQATPQIVSALLTNDEVAQRELRMTSAQFNELFHKMYPGGYQLRQGADGQTYSELPDPVLPDQVASVAGMHDVLNTILIRFRSNLETHPELGEAVTDWDALQKEAEESGDGSKLLTGVVDRYMKKRESALRKEYEEKLTAARNEIAAQYGVKLDEPASLPPTERGGFNDDAILASPDYGYDEKVAAYQRKWPGVSVSS